MPHPIAPHPIRHFTPRRPWSPLDDAEWAALEPLLEKSETASGPKLDLRQRLDAFLHIATTGEPWRKLPEQFGKPDTVSRHFRRLSEAGLWQRLLEALAKPDCPEPLKAIEYWLCRGARRAMRLLGMSGLDLAQKLGFLTALPMVPWMLPNRTYAAAAWAWTRALVADWLDGIRPEPGEIKRLKILHKLAGGARYSSRYAPP